MPNLKIETEAVTMGRGDVFCDHDECKHIKYTSESCFCLLFSGDRELRTAPEGEGGYIIRHDDCYEEEDRQKRERENS